MMNSMAFHRVTEREGSTHVAIPKYVQKHHAVRNCLMHVSHMCRGPWISPAVDTRHLFAAHGLDAETQQGGPESSGNRKVPPRPITSNNVQFVDMQPSVPV